MNWMHWSTGKRLRKLHAWNAWTVLLLAVTGILLPLPEVRNWGGFRVLLKQVHIGLGVLSVMLLLMYLPLARKHWKQLKGKWGQRSNLVFVLLLLAAWAVSGIVLWQFRILPPRWANVALFWHGFVTWIGVPYAVYHSVTRLGWVKRWERDNAWQRQREDGDNGREADWLNRPQTRRTFIRVAAGTLIVIGLGPWLFRFAKSMFDGGGEPLRDAIATDANVMLPEPVPLPDSANVIGGGAEGNFRIYTVTEMPVSTSNDWRFELFGLVDDKKSWNWEQFLSLKRTVQVSDFHCVTGWSVYQCTWEGIPLSALLDAAGVRPEAKFVKFYSGDGVYTDALSLQQARMEDVMVAVLLDGKPLPQKLGGPVRLVVPKMYAYKSVKWLQGIELIEEDHLGYWEVRGYANDAWVGKA